MVRYLMFCLVPYGLGSDVLSRILWFGVLCFSRISWFGVRCFVSYIVVWFLMFFHISYGLVFYVLVVSHGLVSDVLSRILWFGV